ncbi:P-loop containing nucleoside triphosphate hydrolase protein [Pelagophyceae sp. CCMP2097]|nr:P-loop containing nucleoside triphosphate hydrolase protein [Pelagophyceae sp. CCMP2097]
MSVSEYGFGSIVRIKLHNFLTYSEVEFRPGPRLNVVMGPNGTGKSSIVCAIAIGLGASVKVLGRADLVSDFVMNGCDEAYTEIELVSHGGKKMVVRRELARTARGSSKWKLDGKATNEPEVKRVVEEHNIQIANLCTFLPQEKVGEFSSFDSVGLLRETEKALGGQALVDSHDELVKLEKEMQSSDRCKATLRDDLDELKARRDQLLPDKERLEQRQEHLDKAALCAQRLLWMEFESAKEVAKEAREARDAAQTRLRATEAAVEPFRGAARAAHAAAQKLERKFQSKKQECASLKGQASKAVEGFGGLREAIEDHRAQSNNLDFEQETLRKKMETARAKAADQAARVEAAAESVDVEGLQAELAAMRPEMDAARAEDVAAQTRVADANTALRMPQKGRTYAAAQLAQAQNTAARRLDNLAGLNKASSQCARLRRHVDAHAGSFRKPVLGPVSLEVSAKSPRDEHVVESVVGGWIWTAFVCQSKGDYDQLEKITKGDRDYSTVNLLCCDTDYRPPSRPYDEEQFRMLQQKGKIEGYVDELIDCPGAVRQVLNSYSSLHSTLVGAEATEAVLDDDAQSRDLDAVLKSGRSGGGYLIVTSSKADRGGKVALTRHQGIASRYQRGDVTISTAATRGKDILKFLKSTDPAEMLRLQQDLENADEQVAVARANIQEAKAAAEAVAARLRDLEVARGQRTRAVQELAKERALLDRLDKAATQAAAAVAKSDVSAQRARLAKRVSGDVAKLVAGFGEAAHLDGALIDATVDAAAPVLAVKVAYEQKARAEAALREKEREGEALQVAVRAASAKFDELKAEAKRSQEAAKAKADLDEPGLREKLNTLPNDINELTEAIKLERAAAERIHEDKNLLEQYREILKAIVDLEKRVEAQESDLAGAQGRLDALRLPWEARLRAALADLRTKFGGYMQSLRATGDVELVEGDTFDKWGLAILVSFRDAAQLRRLQAHVQSGGERSVSTIMFLMALQAHMPSPFRVVDEINQGMDEVNERIVFNRIVQNSTGPEAPQYFLITPKLLQGLTDMNHPDVRALIVFNGPYNVKRPGDWDLESFKRKKKKLDAN